MKALLLAALLLAAPAADDTTFSQRMQVGRIGALVSFVLLSAGLGLALRKLGQRARSAEEEARLERAFRELDDELARPTKKPVAARKSSRDLGAPP